MAKWWILVLPVEFPRDPVRLFLCFENWISQVADSF